MLGVTASGTILPLQASTQITASEFNELGAFQVVKLILTNQDDQVMLANIGNKMMEMESDKKLFYILKTINELTVPKGFVCSESRKESAYHKFVRATESSASKYQNKEVFRRAVGSFISQDKDTTGVYENLCKEPELLALIEKSTSLNFTKI